MVVSQAVEICAVMMLGGGLGCYGLLDATEPRADRIGAGGGGSVFRIPPRHRGFSRAGLRERRPAQGVVPRRHPTGGARSEFGQRDA